MPGGRRSRSRGEAGSGGSGEAGSGSSGAWSPNLVAVPPPGNPPGHEVSDLVLCGALERLVRRLERPELDDVLGEEQSDGPVERDTDLLSHRRHHQQVV